MPPGLIDRLLVPSACWFIRIGQKIARSLHRVRVGYTDSAGLAPISPNAMVVFVTNRRSSMDLVLAACLIADQAALSYTVGE